MNNPELKITGIKVSEHRSGIPLQGWESVEDALYSFGSGRSKKSRATQNELIDDLESQNIGSLGMGLYFLATAGVNKDKFVEAMLSEAKPTVIEGDGRWRRSFDYDAMGTSFFKSSVEITRLPEREDGYLLGLSAAYVGSEVEDGLAETLGIEQGLLWKSVYIDLEPAGSNFRIDFDAVANRLQPLYEELAPAPIPEPRGFRQRLIEAVKGDQSTKKPDLTGEAIIRTLLATEKWERSANPFVLGLKDGVEVSLKLGRVGYRYSLEDSNRNEELWKTEQAVLSGPLAESYEEGGGFKAPSLIVSIHRYSEHAYNRLPAIDPKMKANMTDLADKVAFAFQPS